MKRWFVALALAAMTVAPAAAQTEAKIAFINSERLFAEFQGFQDAERAYQTELDTWLQELKGREQELARLEAEFRAQEPMLSEDRRQAKQDEFQRISQDYERYRESVFGQGGRAQRRNQEILEPVLATVQAAVERIAERDEYDLILDAVDGNIIYGAKRYDITDLVLEELRSETPGTATGDSGDEEGGG